MKILIPDLCNATAAVLPLQCEQRSRCWILDPACKAGRRRDRGTDVGTDWLRIHRAADPRDPQSDQCRPACPNASRRGIDQCRTRGDCGRGCTCARAVQGTIAGGSLGRIRRRAAARSVRARRRAQLTADAACGRRHRRFGNTRQRICHGSHSRIAEDSLVGNTESSRSNGAYACRCSTTDSSS